MCLGKNSDEYSDGAEAQMVGAYLEDYQELICSIIVPVYNGAATINRCLDALVNQTVDQCRYEIIVVDDGSADDTLAQANGWKSQHPQTHFTIVQQENGGPAAARNLGVAHAQAPLLLFTDADCAPLPQWVQALCGPFGAQPEQKTDNEQLAGTKGTYITEQSSLVAHFVQVEYEERYERMKQHPQIDFIDTYSAAYRRDVFTAHNGFDTRFQIAEDQDLSFRLVAKGYKLLFVAEAQVAHLHVSTVRKYWRRKFWTGYWKAMLVRQHPDRLVQDSHTPQLLKIQMMLSLTILTLLLLLPLGTVWPLLRWLGVLIPIALGAFVLTSVPLLRMVRRRAKVMGAVQKRTKWLPLAGLCLIAVRGAALGTGFILGTTHVFLGKRRGAPGQVAHT